MRDDYCALHKLTVKNKYPVPSIDDVLDQLQSSSLLFAALDQWLSSIGILLEDVRKTAFSTPFGHLAFRCCLLV